MTRLAVALAAGVALHLAYPQPGWDLLGWVSLAPVFALAVTADSSRQAFAEGWMAGWAFFVPLLRWLTHTMTTYSSLPWPLALVVLLGLAAYLALFWGGVTATMAWTRSRFGAGAVWFGAAFWVTAELARTHLLSGFPWGLLGYAPYRRLAVIQLAAWTGVYGVSFLVALVNAALAWIVLSPTVRRVMLGGAVIGLALTGTLALGRERLALPPAETIRVAVVQGNIDQAIKWDRAFREETLRLYGDLTRKAAPGSHLVVWPEAAVPAYLQYEPDVRVRLEALAREVAVPLLVGAPDARQVGGAIHYLNSAFFLTERGVQARYDKMHLVPFGEYVPLKRLLFFVDAIAAEIGDFTPGRRPVLFPLRDTRFGTVICYEVIFPDLFRRFVSGGASFMVNITNDGWFGDSGGPLQHLAMVPLRAVENGVAIVRAANSGVSGLVGQTGAVGPTLGLFERGFAGFQVPVRSGSTFYTRFGDLFAYLCGAATAGIVLARVAAGRGR